VNLSAGVGVNDIEKSLSYALVLEHR